MRSRRGRADRAGDGFESIDEEAKVAGAVDVLTFERSVDVAAGGCERLVEDVFDVRFGSVRRVDDGVVGDVEPLLLEAEGSKSQGIRPWAAALADRLIGCRRTRVGVA